MPPKKVKRRRQKRNERSILSGFRYELIVVLLLVAGFFLLTEKTDVSAIVLGWIRTGINVVIGGITDAFRGIFNYFADYETSDIVGMLLILLAIHLMVMRGRKKLIQQYGEVHTCPVCAHDKMKRVKRKYWHKLFGWVLFLRVKHYQCLECKKCTIRFSYLKN